MNRRTLVKTMAVAVAALAAIAVPASANGPTCHHSLAGKHVKAKVCVLTLKAGTTWKLSSIPNQYSGALWTPYSPKGKLLVLDSSITNDAVSYIRPKGKKSPRYGIYHEQGQKKYITVTRTMLMKLDASWQGGMS